MARSGKQERKESTLCKVPIISQGQGQSRSARISQGQNVKWEEILTADRTHGHPGWVKSVKVKQGQGKEQIHTQCPRSVRVHQGHSRSTSQKITWVAGRNQHSTHQLWSEKQYISRAASSRFLGSDRRNKMPSKSDLEQQMTG